MGAEPLQPGSDVEAPQGADASHTPPSLPYLFVNEHGVVTSDVACRGCGYSLRGFSLAQVCPECGWPVSRSVQGADLLHSPPAYVRTLRSSIQVILIALMVDIVSTFSVVIVDIINDYYRLNWELGALHVGSEAISFAANVVTVWGFWRFTTPDPTLSREQQRTSAYWVLRIATVVAALSGFIDTIFIVLEATGRAAPGGVVGAAISVFSFLVYVLTAAWISAAMRFISAIARRVPDPQLERHSKKMVWLSWVLMFPGMLACFAGPIACIIYFYIAMVRLRSHLARVLAEQGESGSTTGSIA